ncbi:MAG TPA: glucan ABC transporter ATP-binding protein/ permease [Beijerinckiaceae bacterium]|jgi:ATP-binding cassette subfamily B protein|nr:glucan ABC transporter ATP-binding protein/ permease [Beijerinckiaceae bacterium]
MKFVRLYGRALAALGPERYVGVLLAIANVALAAAQFAEPVLFGRIIDTLTAAQAAKLVPGWSSLLPQFALWVGFGAFNIGVGALVALNADRLSHRRRLAVMAEFFEHVLTLPLLFHMEKHSGRALKVMSDGSLSLGGIWLTFFREHCAAFVALFVMLPLTAVLNWRLGLVLILLVSIFALLMTLVLRHTETMQQSVERYRGDLAERVSDALGNVAVIQSFTRVETEARDVRVIIDRLMAVQNPVLSWWALAAIATRASATLTILSILGIGAYLFMQGLTTVGEIVTFVNLASLLVSRLEQVVSFINYIFLEAPRLAEFFEVLDTAPSLHDAPNAVAIGRAKGAVAFERVSFSYDGKRSAVTDLAIDVKPGETIALVGATGSGKSTTLALLHRSFDPQSGRILLDGRDIREITLTSLRRNIGVVFQEPMLFARSIRENLLAGKPEATEEELETAIRRAQAAEFIAWQPEGLDTLIGERGRSLSGGERQRLSIARALLKDPPILILDEATSALDAATEERLQRALDEVMIGRTTFVIAHRLSTIRHATRVLVFDQGRVVETGSFDELIGKGGSFAKLAQGQFATQKH